MLDREREPETFFIFADMYPLLRQLLFLLDPEKAHYLSMDALQAACSAPPVKSWIEKQFRCRDENLSREVFGLTFTNPVGLGAGFDKNALYLRELEALGFGFVEIGTVTPRAQDGNDKPRLFRLPEDRALVNRMGFNNDGVEKVARRLQAFRAKSTSGYAKIIIGGNIGKNKDTPNTEAWKDYEIGFRKLADCVDYFVVNVSSPNTPGLRELQEKDALNKILSHLQDINAGASVRRPLLLKIAPDLSSFQLDDIIGIAKAVGLSGLVATNTTIDRLGLKTPDARLQVIGAGGLSGLPLRERACQVVQYIRDKTGGALPVIGSGGIFTGEDASQRLAAGASLVQVWTGFIYEGPAIVKNICQNLAKNG